MTNQGPFNQLKEMNRGLAALKYLLQSPSIETMPQWVSFQNTHFCNLRCPHCQTHGTAENRRHCNNKNLNMTSEMLTAVANEALPYADEFTLTLTGEPLATPDIEEVLPLLSSFGAKLDLITNGTLLTKEKLRYLIPILKRVQISVDGTTAQTFESIRAGASFKNVLNNIRLLTLVCNRIPSPFRPRISLSYTIMGSNIHEFPNVVDLAAYLGIPEVNAAFVQVFYPSLADEAVELYKPLYNSSYWDAWYRAEKLGIIIGMPNPFPGVRGDGAMRVTGEKTIIPLANRDEVKPFTLPESLLDEDRLQADAAALQSEILDILMSRQLDIRFLQVLRKRRSSNSIKPGSRLFNLLWNFVFSNPSTRRERILFKMLRRVQVSMASLDRDGGAANNHRKMQDIFLQVVKNHQMAVEKLMYENSNHIRFCNYLYKCTYIYPSGNVLPCCEPDVPVMGNITRSSLKEIWNGEPYNEFRSRFFSDKPVKCCAGCRYIKYVPIGFLLKQAKLSGFQMLIDGQHG